MINSGIIIMRNNPWTRTFIEMWRSNCCNPDGSATSMNDQQGFEVAYRKLNLRHKVKIAIVETGEINTELPAIRSFVSSWESDSLNGTSHNHLNAKATPILHLAAESVYFREAVFREMASQQVCNGDSIPVRDEVLNHTVFNVSRT